MLKPTEMVKNPINFFRIYLKPYLTEPEKQPKTTVFVSLSFLSLLILFGIRPVFIETLSLLRMADDGREMEGKLTRRIDNLNKAAENIGNVRTDINLIDRSLPNNKDLPAILEGLNLIFGTNNVILEEIRFGPPRPANISRVLILPIKIRASGNYEGILAVLENLEKYPRQTDAVSISLEIPQKGDRKFLRMFTEMETYFLAEL